MELPFNHQGIPLISFAHNVLASTTGTPSSSAATPPNEDPETFDSQKIYPWGSGDNFPDDAEAIIRKSTVLNSGLKYKLQTILGQGIFPAKVSGYKDNGEEILEVIEDVDLRFCNLFSTAHELYYFCKP